MLLSLHYQAPTGVEPIADNDEPSNIVQKIDEVFGIVSEDTSRIMNKFQELLKVHRKSH